MTLKSKIFYNFKLFYFLLIFGMVIFGSGYFFLDSRLEKTKVSFRTESVPYYTAMPDNKGVCFEVCNDKILLYFDFKQSELSVIYPTESEESDLVTYGYPVDYTVSCDYEMIGYFVDAVGGIELKTGNETLRYTGVQITEMLKFTGVSEETKHSIAKEIIAGFGEMGFTKENLLHIIEESDTNLKFNDSFSWVEYIKELCKSPRFVN